MNTHTKIKCRRCGRTLNGINMCDCPLDPIPKIYWKENRLSCRKALRRIKKKANIR